MTNYSLLDAELLEKITGTDAIIKLSTSRENTKKNTRDLTHSDVVNMYSRDSISCIYSESSQIPPKPSRLGVGSLIQLAAKGPQGDFHEKGTSWMFQAEPKRHTAFSIDHETIDIKNFGFGQTVNIEVPRTGDLVSRIYLHLKLPALHIDFKYQNNLAFVLIKKVTIYIGDQIFQDLPGHYLNISHIMHSSAGHESGLDSMLGMKETDIALNNKQKDLFIDIPLFCSKTIKQFLPLSALHEDNVKLHITFNPISEIYTDNKSYTAVQIKPNRTGVRVSIGVAKNDLLKSNGQKLVDNDIKAGLFVDYINLDDFDKSMLTSKQNNLVFDQLLTNTEKVTSNLFKFDLGFITLPVKQIIWVLHATKELYTDFTTTESNNEEYNVQNFVYFPIDKARLYFGDVAFTDSMDSQYFKHVQGFIHNTNVPHNELNVYSYAFALLPHQCEPTGDVNFGKLQKRLLEIQGTDITGMYMTVYAICVNSLDSHDGRGVIRFT